MTADEANKGLFAAGSRVLAKPVTIGKLLRCVADALETILETGAPLSAQPCVH